MPFWVYTRGMRHTRDLLLFACAALVSCLYILTAGPPAQANDPQSSDKEATQAVVGTAWMGREAPASATAFTFFTEEDTTTEALIPWEAVMVVSCTGEAVACFLQDHGGITIDADMVLTDSSTVTGNGNDGRGPCWHLPAGLPVPKRNTRARLQSPVTAVGRRSGACMLAGAATGRPCDTSADCEGSDYCSLYTAGAGAGTSASDRFSWTSGAYLGVISVGGSSITCYANVDK